MDETAKRILKNVAGSTARAALVFVGSWLVKKGVITEGESVVLVDNLTPVVFGLLLTLAALAWGWWQKVHVNRKVDAALAAPPELTRAEFERSHAEPGPAVKG